MKKTFCILLLTATLIPVMTHARDPEFSRTADDILRQLEGGDTPPSGFAGTRSFVVESKANTRSITVVKKNAEGAETAVTVPVGPVEPTARLKVEFDVDSAMLRPGAYTILKELARALEDEKIVGATVCIKGHTDSDGDEDHNLRLSFKRAASVKSYLSSFPAIVPHRLHVFGYGEAMPLYPNDTTLHRQANRRVEISLHCREAGE